MHRVHHFWTSSDAFDASLDEGEVREGDVLVVVGERVVGLASTDPIAVTVNAGALRPFPALARAQLLDELVHGEAAIAAAVDEAVRHGFPVANHFHSFATESRPGVEHAAHVVFSLDDVAVVLDTVDRRIAALEGDPGAADGATVAERIERLRTARERLAGYTRSLPPIAVGEVAP